MKRQDSERTAGILMPLASLPSDEGIGCLGADSYHFVDLLADMGMHVWQLLPLTPLGYGNSPYQPFASCAGDGLYISLTQLVQDGLLPADKLPAAPQDTGRIDYAAVRAQKEPLLREACDRFYETEADSAEFRAFCKKDWVYPYAVFIALKRQNGLRPWTDWPQEQRDWIIDRKYDLTPLRDEVRRGVAEQFLFFRQWQGHPHHGRPALLRGAGFAGGVEPPRRLPARRRRAPDLHRRRPAGLFQRRGAALGQPDL